MGDVRLVAPKVRVIRANGTDPLEIQTDNRDLVGYERTRLRHKWPAFNEAPFQWLTFISWSAARRAGVIDAGLTFEKWEAEVLSVGDMAGDEDEELGNPIPEAPETG